MNPQAAADRPAVALPRTEGEIARAAGVLGFNIPEACMPGVVANLALLDSHAAILLGEARGAP